MDLILPSGDSISHRVTYPKGLLSQDQLNDPSILGFEKVRADQLKKGTLVVFDDASTAKDYPGPHTCCLVTEVYHFYDDIGYGEFGKVKLTYIDLVEGKE